MTGDHGRTVRSPVPCGRIRRIELDPAFDWRDVVVADHRDIPGENVVALIEDDQPLLAADRVRHAEEPVLLVAHADPERAEAARAAVRLEIGTGRYAGAELVVVAEPERIAVELRLPEAATESGLAERLRERLEARGYGADVKVG